MVTLTTPRLRLRPIDVPDLDEFHGLCVDPDIRRFLFDDQAIPLEQARTLVEASQAAFVVHGYGLWLVHELGMRTTARELVDGRPLVYFVIPGGIDET